MDTKRLEAFSDGVIAIIITIMVLEMKVPHGNDLNALKPLLPVFSSYVLSFIYIGIYWNNHHHMMHLVSKITGVSLWANLHLLFWLSIIPFVTGWMGENHFAAVPVAVYSFVLLMAGTAYYILFIALKSCNENKQLAQAIGTDWKGVFSVVIYIIAIILSLYNSMLSLILIAFVAIMWFIPDKRVEKALDKDHHH